MPIITKIDRSGSNKKLVKGFDGMAVADIDHFKIDLIRYIQGKSRKKKVEIAVTYEDMHPAGGWAHQDEVENY